MNQLLINTTAVEKHYAESCILSWAVLPPPGGKFCFGSVKNLLV